MAWGKGWGKSKGPQQGSWGVQKPWTKKGQSFHVGFQARDQQQRRNAGKMQGVVPKDFEVDQDKRYTGTVSAYWKLQGYGFINVDAQGVVPDDKLFVYWTNIQSSDRFPQLTKGMQVEFSIVKEVKRGVTTVNAGNVTLTGGVDVTLQDEADGKKTFVGGQQLRYTGKLKFFIPKRGYGYILMDEGFQFEVEGVPQQIRVEIAEVNAGGKQPAYMKDVDVEFGIWQTQKGAFKAYNMTAPGGVPLPSADEAASASKD